MRNAMNCDVCNGIGLLFARLPLGISLACVGIMKFRGGVEAFVSKSSGSIPSYMPEHLGNMYLHVVPYAETALGILLVLGLFTRVSGLLATLMLISFAMAVTGFINVQGGMPLQPPTLFACFALVVVFAGPGAVSLDRLLFGRRRGRVVAE